MKLFSRLRPQPKPEVPTCHDIRSYIPNLQNHPTPIDGRLCVADQTAQGACEQLRQICIENSQKRFSEATKRQGLTTEQALEYMACKHSKLPRSQEYPHKLGRMITGKIGGAEIELKQVYGEIDQFSGTKNSVALSPEAARELFLSIQDIFYNRLMPDDRAEQDAIVRKIVSIYLKERDAKTAHDNRGFLKKLGHLMFP